MFMMWMVSLYVMGVCFINTVSTRPLKVFAKGYSSRTLPAGGWTHWFNVDYPDGAGDFETYRNIVRLYGRTCMGIPCRRPLAIKAVTVFGRSPRVNGDRVTVTPRFGLKCHAAHQQNYQCQDYKVRFYCANLHLDCSESQFYPQHHHHQNHTYTVPDTLSANTNSSNKIVARLSRKKLRLLKKYQTQMWQNHAIQKTMRKIRKRRVKSHSWPRNDKTTRLPTITSDVYQPQPTFLTYHPRHPLFS